MLPVHFLVLSMLMDGLCCVVAGVIANPGVVIGGLGFDVSDGVDCCGHSWSGVSASFAFPYALVQR